MADPGLSGALTPEELKKREVEERKKKVEEMMKRMGTGSPRGSATRPRRVGTRETSVNPSTTTLNEEGDAGASVGGNVKETNNGAKEGIETNKDEEERKQRRIQVERLRKRLAGQGELTEEEIQKILAEPTTLESAASSISAKTADPPIESPSPTPTTMHRTTTTPPLPPMPQIPLPGASTVIAGQVARTPGAARPKARDDSAKNTKSPVPGSSPYSKNENVTKGGVAGVRGEEPGVRQFASAKRQTASLDDLATKYKGFGAAAGEAEKRELEKRLRMSEMERWLSLYDRFSRRQRGKILIIFDISEVH